MTSLLAFKAEVFPMNNKTKTKLLTISLLCCGRAETTERCLKSLMPIREAIDSEIQVVDTGCSPETRAIVDKYADEVFEFTWVNDFAAARNFQLDQANGKMFLFIDDDEWFLDCKYIIDFFKDPECLTYNIGGYFQRNYLDFEGTEYQDIEVVRMCAVTPETVFIGKVHEYIEPAYGNAMFMDARAGHFGYVYENEEDNIKHSLRNVPLLEEMMEEQPENLRWPFQLAQELRAIKDYEKLLSICSEGIKKSYEIKENDSIRYRATFVIGVATALIEMDRWDELIDFYNEQMEKDDIMEVPKAKLGLYAAKVYFVRKQDSECEKVCNYYLEIYDKYKDERGMVFLQGGIFINDVFDEYFVNFVYCYLMGCGLRRNDYGPLTHYYRKISWNSPVLRLNRGFVSLLLDSAANVGYKKEINDVLKKFFTRPAMRDVFQYEIEDKMPKISVENLQNLKEAFRDTKGQKEMNLFFDIRLIEKRLSLEEEYEGYEDLISELTKYSDAAKAWQKCHFEWMEKEAPRTLQPEAELGEAMYTFIELSDKEPTEALKVLRDSMGLRPAMDKVLGNLARLYSRIQKVLSAKKADPEKFQQMYNLEEQLLRQIAELDSAGRTDEAVATYQQLVEILQNTYGVDSLHV